MNEQRQQAYLNLIETLLTCSDDEEPEILAANRELLDADFVVMVEAVAEMLSQEQEDENTINWLRGLASQLREGLNLSPPEDGEEDLQDYLNFLLDVLQTTSESEGNPEVVYPLLAANTDKLDDIFAAILRWWAREQLPELEADTVTSIAAVIGEFSNLIAQFPLGSKASNMEIAIAGYEIVGNIFTPTAFPQIWARIQNNLGEAYRNRIVGEKADNLELAIAAHNQALTVTTPEAFPQDWAMTQNNLGAAYSDRIVGEKADNLELAIAAYNLALTVYTPEGFPQQWATTQNNLGAAYSDRIVGEKADNLELAIASFNQALTVRTPEAFPQQWATTQNNLGIAYLYRIVGEKADNLELAIAAFNQALTVRTPEAFPQDWAKTQNNLGEAYRNRIVGEKADNLEKAIAAYNQALTVYTPEAFPQNWAMTQNNLGNAYSDRIVGEKADNLELAIAAYNQALTVRTPEAFPQDWAKTQNNLGEAYRNRIVGEKADNLEKVIAAYNQALTVTTREAFPQDWATMQNNLGNAYRERIVGEKADNLEKAIAAYNQALTVTTREAFPQDWATMQNNLGIAYRNRIVGEKADNLELAIAAYNLALTVYTPEAFPQEWARTQNNLGTAYLYRIVGEKADNLELAIAAYNLALTVRTPEAFPQNWAMTQNNLGNAYLYRIVGEKADNLELAIAAYNQALTIYTPEAFPQDWAQTQNNLGNAYSDRIVGEKADNLELAIAAYNLALTVYTPEAFPQNHANTAFNLGLAYQEQQDFLSAYTTFADAITTVETIREEMVSGEEIKRKQSEEWNQLYVRMVEVCLSLERETEAIEYVERSKTRNLVELILERDFKTIFPADVITQLEKLRDEIAVGQNQIQTGKAANIKELAQHLQQLRQQRNQLQNEYLPVGYGFNFNQFQGSLGEQTAIIEWYITDTSVETFIITQSSLQRVHIADRNDNLVVFANWVNEYLRAYYSNKTEWKDNLNFRLNHLAEILHLEEVIQLVPNSCSRLVLIPHRYLHLFPLHALPLAEGGFLYDKFSQGVSYAPSCQLLQQLQKRNRPNFESLFAIQNPTEDLDYADLEVHSILNLFSSHSSQVLPYKEATKDALLQQIPQLKDANYLHFSCHGSFNLDSPQDSCLLLAESVDKNNKLDLSKCLTLGNLFERNFQLDNCRLVVLSACETGLVDLENTSDEYISLPSGFLYAGSRSVVSSLWTVNESSTAFLMIKFSQNLQAAIADNRDFSVAVELQEAQTWLRDVTKEELHTWASKLQSAEQHAQQIKKYLRWFKPEEQPFRNPTYWAAFCAIGK
ncbi:MAG: CHAT domain-containing protein [Calothrix sp. MO_192.B10]|nr:CHAT domain-containing protein [Calothrix sp. MO_192.B10]